MRDICYVLVICLQIAERHGANDMVCLEPRPVATLDADLGLVEVHFDDLLAKENPLLDGIKLLCEHVLWMVRVLVIQNTLVQCWVVGKFYAGDMCETFSFLRAGSASRASSSMAGISPRYPRSGLA